MRMPLKWRPDGKKERVCRLSAAYAGADRCKRSNGDLFDENVLKDISFDDGGAVGGRHARLQAEIVRGAFVDVEGHV